MSRQSSFKRRIFILAVALSATLSTRPILAALPSSTAPAWVEQSASGTSVAVDAKLLSFVFESQDGGFSFPCRHEISHPVLQDWAVTCADPERPTTERKFTVHLRVFRYQRPEPPKMSYEIHYWVINHAIAPDQQGHFVGSTIWMNFDEPTPLRSFDLSQDIESTTSLRLRAWLGDESR